MIGTEAAESEFPETTYDVYWSVDGAFCATVVTQSESEAIEQALADVGLYYTPASMLYAIEREITP